MEVGLAVAGGIGIGFLLGCLFARLDQRQMFGIVTQASDSIIRSALFPGMPKEVFEAPAAVAEPAEDMYAQAEDPQMPDWLKDEGPWDPTEEEGS